MQNDKNILSLHALSKSFGQGIEEIVVIGDLSVDFIQGTSYAITGVSGTGKSTLIHLLAGIDAPTKGQVLYNGIPLPQMNTNERQLYAQDSIGLIFQFPYLIKELSIVENIMLKGLIKGYSKNTSFDRAHALLDMVGLFEKKDRSPAVLSGGEQQRVALARALYKEPKFLLADEPTAHLDEKNRDSMLQILLDAKLVSSMGLIITTHDPYIAKHMDKELQLRAVAKL